jgi:hypothetical protein
LAVTNQQPGGYHLTGYTRGGWKPGMKSGASASPTPIYSWVPSAPAQAQAAPKPEPKPKPKPAAPVKTPENPYKKQADDLLKTIDKVLNKPAPEPPPPPKPVTVFSGASALNGGDLQIAPANKATKNTGTGGFKRRKTATPTTNTLRTVQSLNV